MEPNVVVTTLQSLANDMKAIITDVAPIGLGIMGVFLGFRYGKRIFFTLAK